MKPFDALDKTFDIVPVEEEIVAVAESNNQVTSVREQDKKDDYITVRANLISLMMKGQQIVDEVMDVASQSQQPRAFEVAINSVKSVSEVADKLIDLHKKMNDLETEETKITQNNVQNNVFVAGTTAEIMKMMKDMNSSK